ncbi:F-box/LRR-repeat protein 17 [Tripterygium wilfordii]|uniref:F-box/LRR-repeat protein 17 n=1 Tax=Tripterygium wilfordii TaxID=458696 RepID=A0A7J7CXU9_TRIWF|nr:F-box/LRR-repeat protein 17-like [Tripterygium wilfordii]KAF5738890.1 F-box/LRR-repeat protein 17 [Tripterygium wilfordii]
MHRQSHLSPSGAASPIPFLDFRNSKKNRGSYNCGRCGLPKKGHTCHIGTPSNSTTITTATPADSSAAITSSASSVRPPQALQRHTNSNLRRRALSFDDIDFQCESPTTDIDEFAISIQETDPDLSRLGGLPMNCLWEVLRRLPPADLSSAAKVCTGWRETVRKLWRAAEELKLRVPARAQLGFSGLVLQKCPNLVRLTLRMESDVDATMLACIAFSCPNLEFMEISTSHNSVNRITGDELGRFVVDKRCLASLKMEGCTNLGGFALCSSSLSTLWLADLHSLAKMVFNCPNLKEISLDFSRQENDSTDLITMVDGLGRTCPRLQNIHIASDRLSHAAVLALTAANLRGLRMLSLILGSEITDASVAAIASSYSKLELLDLSGSSVSDSGIGMICNVFPATLSRLLIALCPNITSSGVQFATAQLPLLEIMDCGMTISDPNSQYSSTEESNESELQLSFNKKLHLMYQKLIIKHGRLKKLSLWGCSGLDALYLNCPELNDLNLNSCTNLHPDRLLLQCPSLESVHASGCQDSLILTIRSQVRNSFDLENQFPRKRLADGSKRVQVPHFLFQQTFDENKKRRKMETRHCNVLVD